MARPGIARLPAGFPPPRQASSFPQQTRPRSPTESSSPCPCVSGPCYGLVVLVPLLPTPPRGDAVTVRYPTTPRRRETGFHRAVFAPSQAHQRGLSSARRKRPNRCRLDNGAVRTPPPCRAGPVPGFKVRKPSSENSHPALSPSPTPCRLQSGDPAACKAALRRPDQTIQQPNPQSPVINHSFYQSSGLATASAASDKQNRSGTLIKLGCRGTLGLP